jgi:hypothetical protein
MDIKSSPLPTIAKEEDITFKLSNRRIPATSVAKPRLFECDSDRKYSENNRTEIIGWQKNKLIIGVSRLKQLSYA